MRAEHSVDETKCANQRGGEYFHSAIVANATMMQMCRVPSNTLKLMLLAAVGGSAEVLRACAEQDIANNARDRQSVRGLVGVDGCVCECAESKWAGPLKILCECFVRTLSIVFAFGHLHTRAA